MQGWLETVSQIGSIIVTISGAITVIGAVLNKILKKTLVKATTDAVTETINKQMSASQENIDKQLADLNEKIQNLATQLHEYEEKQDLVNQDVKNTLKGLIRDRINEAHDVYVVRGFVGAHSLECLEELYKQYRAFGGNSFVSKEMEELRTLPMRSAETDMK